MSTIRVEAESMNLATYRLETNSSASGGQVVSLLGEADNENGYASYTFTGTAGLYDVVLGYYDETDGVSKLEVKQNSTILDSWSLNQSLGSAAPTAQTLVRRKVAQATSITPGTVFQIKGTENQGEYARIDYIEFIPLSTPSAETGNGLMGEYFNTSNLKDPVLVRTDSTVNFNWGGNPPAPSVRGDGNYSVRWSGQVKPQYSETYTFYTTSDDGVRLWVNNQLIIDKWVNQSPTQLSGSINLVAGQKYDIKLEYFQGGGSAQAQLSWSSASQPKQIIPKSRLFSVDTVAPEVTLSAPNLIANGALTYDFTVNYQDASRVDVATVGTGDVLVTGPNGFSQVATLVSINSTTNGSDRTATYRITAPNGTWNASDVGTYTVKLQPNQVSDTLGNTADSVTLGTFNFNTAPTVALPGLSNLSAGISSVVSSLALPTGSDVFNPTLSLLNGTVGSQSPIIAEWTRTAGPGDTIVLTGWQLSKLTGSQFGSDTKFWVYGQTKSNDGVLAQAEIQKLDGDTAAITLPATLPKGSNYILWAVNNSGASQPVMINQTEVWWVGPDAATRGQVTSIFGRNLSQDGGTSKANVYIEDSTGKGYWAEVVAVNPYKIDFKVPQELANGTYKVSVHNGDGGQYGWSKALSMTVNNGLNYTGSTFNVKNFGAVGDGVKDDTAAILAAMNAAKASNMSTIYLPTGTYVISDAIYIGSGLQAIRWLGDGKNSTTIKAANGFNKTYMFVGSGDKITFQNLTLDANYKNAVNLEKVTQIRHSNDIQYLNVRINAEGTQPFDWHENNRVFMKNSEVTGRESFLGTASQVFIDNTKFFGTTYAETILSGFGTKMVSVTNSTAQNLDNSDPNNGKWVKGRLFADQSVWSNSKFQYFGNNQTIDLAPPNATNIDQNSGEQILWETIESSSFGAVTASTANTVTFTAPAAVNDSWSLTIVGGKGIGQTRQVKSYNSATKTYEIEGSWNVKPDSSSNIVASQLPTHLVVYGNKLDGTVHGRDTLTASAGVEPYHGASDLIVDNNTFNEMRKGVAIFSGVGYFRPVYFTQITNNKFTDSLTGISFNTDTGVSKTNQTNVLGTVARGNYLNNITDAIGMYYDPDSGSRDVNMNVFEKNTLGSITNFITNVTSTNNNIQNNVFLQNNFLQNNFLPSDLVENNGTFHTNGVNIYP